MDRIPQPNPDHDITLGAEPAQSPTQRQSGGHSRRDVVRTGVKLAFVAPVLSTFFAKDAYAAEYSCYAAGRACGGPGQEDCCDGACNLGVCP